jgi:hypothetical protein
VGGRDLHDSQAEHACQCDALPERDLYVEEVLCWPEENDEIAQCVLARVEVVDCFDVEAFRGSDVLEDFPVCACWSMTH